MIAPNEISRTRNRRRRTHQITKGDAVVIPHGLPHQFTAVKGELHYFVCKSTAAPGSAQSTLSHETNLNQLHLMKNISTFLTAIFLCTTVWVRRGSDQPR